MRWSRFKKISAFLGLFIESLWIIVRYRMYKDTKNPDNTRHVQYFCQRLCKILNLELHLHGELPQHTVLWASNHISFLDIPVLGSISRLFFLSKAEIARWPVVGFLARVGGTLFIQRGSGDTAKIGQQMAQYLHDNIPILFFPEATTTDGQQVKRIYGKLFAAALETQTPIKLALICYVNTQGQLEPAIPFINQMSFAEHAVNVLDIQDTVHVHIKLLDEIDATGQDLKGLTQLVQQRMEQGLAELHQDVLQQGTVTHSVDIAQSA